MNKLSLRRNPLALVASRAPWIAAGYLLTSQFVGAFLFAVVLAVTVTTSVLGITLLGVPLLIAAAAVVRGSAEVERARLTVVTGVPIHGQYREPARPGLIAHVVTRWTDPALWRDLTYLLALWAPLLVLDTAALFVWVLLLGGITLPIWYRYPSQTFGIGVNGRPAGSAHGIQLGYFPNGPNGHPSWGLFVNTEPRALAVAGACLILSLLFNYALVAAARLHAAIANAMLRPPEDPLREAREVLSRPGPLTATLPYDPR
jgi:hypothetical protein